MNIARAIAPVRLPSQYPFLKQCEINHPKDLLSLSLSLPRVRGIYQPRGFMAALLGFALEGLKALERRVSRHSKN